ncbi:MAG TPA: HAMP domain-containing sensor histidine kinase [Chitinophagaceae bacterium]|nr:HAMP domain-containing sensor histidine kinase [Chitinophagaceae bacterium]
MRGWPRASVMLMLLAILGITGFQVYWMKNNYDREKQNLDIKTQAAFRQTILALQSSKLKLDKLTLRMDSSFVPTTMGKGKKLARKSFNRPLDSKEPAISVLNLVEKRLRDSLRIDREGNKTMVITLKNDSLRKIVLDSLTKLKGTLHSFSIVHSGDSLLPPPGMIREVHVDNSSGKVEDRVITVDTRKKADTLTLEKRQGMFIESRLPASPSFPAAHVVPGEDEMLPERNAVVRFLYDVDAVSIKDSVTVKEITAAYSKRLKDDKIPVSFRVNRVDSNATVPAGAVTIGFTHPTSFELSLQSTFGYMFSKLKLPLLFSLLLVGITIASFVLLYRNMLRQQRLAELKNEFISNITHELKTPIATVGVAIEALKNFNAIDDPLRTQEYLSISQNELQRLNLLVDKVLKLSMFEKKEIELKYETFNLKELVDEVVASMRLQVEKYRATVSVHTEGQTTLRADRLHLLSVVFNLLDNALKYSREEPVISINLKEEEDNIFLRIADNGIGIAPEYRDKVFDKFFRVPHGDTHNAKGYGLGLSYVAHVVRRHKGNITVDSQPGQGTAFEIRLPKQ